MEIIRGLKNFNLKLEYPVACIGVFDGIHLGHQKIIKETLKITKEKGGKSILITFYPHPLKVISPDRAPKLITTHQEKIKIAEELGIDILLILNFTSHFAKYSAEEFIRKILVSKLQIKDIIVGYNFNFGYQKKGNVQVLRKMSKKYNFKLNIVPPVKLKDEVISSSLVRSLLKKGEIEKVTAMLGRYPKFTGKVIRGQGRGKDIGFPTANLSLNKNKLIPAKGVYAGTVCLPHLSKCLTIHGGDERSDEGQGLPVDMANKKKKVLPAVINIGIRPTFSFDKLHFEVHIIDFKDNLYGRFLEVSLVKYLRSEKKFPQVSQLIDQINKDIDRSKKLLERELLYSASG